MNQTNEASEPALAAHTPGPWAQGLKHPGRVIATDSRRVIAYCTPHPDDDDSPTEQEQANARLIASAPDLLAICQEIAGDQRCDLCDSERRIRLYAAIAKATRNR